MQIPGLSRATRQAMLSSALLDFVEHLEHRDLGSVAALALRRVVGSGDAAAAEPVPGDVAGTKNMANVGKTTMENHHFSWVTIINHH